MSLAAWMWMSLAWSAETGTLQVHTDGPLPAPAVEAVTWHAFQSATGHRLQLTETPEHTLPALGSTTHIDVEVRWTRCAVPVVDESAVTRCPNVRATEHRLGDDGLVHHQTVRTWAPPTPLWIHNQWMIQPEQALQVAMLEAARQLTGPTWHRTEAALHVPVVVYADDAWRARHGDAWQQVARDRIHDAADLLEDADLDLSIVRVVAWAPDATHTTLETLLHDLGDAHVGRPVAVGLTGRVSHGMATSPEDVGRALHPGNALVVASQLPSAGQPARWPGIDESVAIAHELLHSLGVGHVDAPMHLMSAHKTTSVNVLHPQTIALAKAAAEARWVHWDAATAADSLAITAAAWLPPSEQLPYVREALLLGPRLPDPEHTLDRNLGALATAGIASAYAHRAERTDDHWASTARVLHSAALTAAPERADDWIDALGPIDSVWLQDVPTQAPTDAR